MQETLAQKKLDYERRLAAVKEKEDALKQRQEELTNFAKESSARIHAADAKVCRYEFKTQFKKCIFGQCAFFYAFQYHFEGRLNILGHIEKLRWRNL